MHKTDLKWVKIARIWHKYDFYGKIWEMSSYMPATALPNSKTWPRVLIVQGQVNLGWLVYDTMLYCMSMSSIVYITPLPVYRHVWNYFLDSRMPYLFSLYFNGQICFKNNDNYFLDSQIPYIFSLYFKYICIYLNFLITEFCIKSKKDIFFLIKSCL